MNGLTFVLLAKSDGLSRLFGLGGGDVLRSPFARELLDRALDPDGRDRRPRSPVSAPRSGPPITTHGIAVLGIASASPGVLLFESPRGRPAALRP